MSAYRFVPANCGEAKSISFGALGAARFTRAWRRRRSAPLMVSYCMTAATGAVKVVLIHVLIILSHLGYTKL